MKQELEAMRRALVIRNYAAKTVSTYVSVLGRYLGQLDKPVEYSGPTGAGQGGKLVGLMLRRGKKLGERTRNHYTKEFKFKVAIAAIKGEKQLSELAAEFKVHQTLISNWKRQLMEQGAGVFDTKAQKSEQDPVAVSEELVKTIGHQTIQIDWLKKARDLRVVERRSMIGPDDRLSIQQQCGLLALSRSGYYYIPEQETELNLRLLRRIDEIHVAEPTWGSRMLRDKLALEGDVVNRKRIKRLMAILRIKVIFPGKNLSKRNQAHKVYPYLLRGLAITRPNQVWSTDITYIRLRRGWVYLVAILDWATRAVLSWRVSNTCDRFFCIEALEEALRIYGSPQIFNTDQGATFTSPDFTKPLLDLGVKISMDGKGRALDNIITERFWRTVKYDEVYLKDYGSMLEAKESLGKFIHKYNTQRPHSACNGQPPLTTYTSSLEVKVPA